MAYGNKPKKGSNKGAKVSKKMPMRDGMAPRPPIKPMPKKDEKDEMAKKSGKRKGKC